MTLPDLELSPLGNGSYIALVDERASIVWACLPQYDADPVFCSLLEPVHIGHGHWSLHLEEEQSHEQNYAEHSPVLVTRLTDGRGQVVEITDFAPRFKMNGRIYHPLTLMRRVRPLVGTPRLRVELRPLADHGSLVPGTTHGSNHVRYLLGSQVLRLTSDLPVPFLLKELPIVLDRPFYFVLGPDETLGERPDRVVEHQLRETLEYWREWTRYLSIPFEWQDAVLRAAVSLKLCQFESTGAIIAAPTTSIPEAPDSGRNWDYRYCWLRDAAFVVRALNRLGATRSMEDYLQFLLNVIHPDRELQPVYGVTFETHLEEREVPGLRGFGGMGPVRIGNAAWRQPQYDVYGSIILAAEQTFFDHRLLRRGDHVLFTTLEALGETAWRHRDDPDAGLWEYRGQSDVHTYTAMLVWVACDRLARIAARLGRDAKAATWRRRAQALHAEIEAWAYDETRGHFVAGRRERVLDASLLTLPEFGFLSARDPRFVATVAAIERELRHGDYLFRYAHEDDFGRPQTSFNLCTFWYINALAALGRVEEARGLFENLLAHRTKLGLLSEDIDPRTGRLWGNFPQTYSLVGLIACAMRLSRPWEDAL